FVSTPTCKSLAASALTSSGFFLAYSSLYTFLISLSAATRSAFSGAASFSPAFLFITGRGSFPGRAGAGGFGSVFGSVGGLGCWLDSGGGLGSIGGFGSGAGRTAGSVAGTRLVSAVVVGVALLVGGVSLFREVGRESPAGVGGFGGGVRPISASGFCAWA